MGIFSNLFGKKQSGPRAPEHAVIVRFSYGQVDLQPIFDLEDLLIEAISAAGAGEYDGNEVAVDGSDGVMYMYGPDGDRLFHVVKPILMAADFLREPNVIIRYGPPGQGVKERRIQLGS